MRDLMIQDVLGIVENMSNESYSKVAVWQLMHVSMHIAQLKDDESMYIALDSAGHIEWCFGSFDYIATLENAFTFYKWVLRVKCIDRDLDYEVVAIRGDNSESWF